MKVNGHWFDVYERIGDRDTEEHIKGEEVDTMLTVMYIPVRESADAVYLHEQQSKNEDDRAVVLSGLHEWAAILSDEMTLLIETQAKLDQSQEDK